MIIAIDAIIINIINAIVTACLTSCGIEPPGLLMKESAAANTLLKNELSIFYLHKIYYVILA